MVILVSEQWDFSPREIWAELSPSFDNQQINDPIRDWDIADYVSGCNNDNDFPHPDIQGVDYVSDGKTLNATMWLSSPVRQSENNHHIEYHIYLDIISRYDDDPDYYWYLLNNGSRAWIAGVDNIRPSFNFSRPIAGYNYYPGILWEGLNYINMSLDLGLINYPEQYNLIAGIFDYFPEGGQECGLIDFTSWVSLPPPHYNLTLPSTPIKVRPGGTIPLPLTITSDANVDSDVELSTRTTTKLELNLDPKTVYLPPAGSDGYSLEVSAPKTMSDGIYTIYIDVNATLSQSIYTPEREHKNNEPVAIQFERPLQITVLPPLSIPEQFMDYFSKYINPLTGLLGILVGAIVALIPLIASWYDRRRKRIAGNGRPDKEAVSR